jgi:hypothetical protein
MGLWSYILQEEVTQDVSEQIVHGELENAVHIAEADSTTGEKEKEDEKI